MQASQISIIIVNWNTCQLLDRCLTAIAETSCQLKTETVVVDNNSTDGSQAMTKSQHPGVHLVCAPDNLGFARANNIGIRKAIGDYILLLNSDTEVRDNALDRMFTSMETHSTVGIVGARLLNADGTSQCSYGSFPARPRIIVSRKIIDTFAQFYRRPHSDQLPESNAPVEVDWVTGAALMIRRTTLEQIGLLDERFFMYAEEIDLCMRSKQNGWHIHYLPTAEIYHLKQGSSAEMPELRKELNQRRETSLELLYRKHYGCLASIGLHIIHRVQHLGQARNRQPEDATRL